MWKSLGFICYLLSFRDRGYKSENVGTTDKFKSIVIRSKNESGQNNSLRISFVDRKIFFLII